MPTKRPRRYRSISSLVSNNSQSLDAHSTEAQTLFRFLVLVVDIKYRNKYGHRLGEGDTRNGSEQHKKVVADQIPSVDTGLLRH